MDLPVQAHGLPLDASVFVFRHKAPGEFVIAGGACVASRTPKEFSNEVIAGRVAIPGDFAEYLVAAIIGPHRPANHASGSVVEYNRLRPESNSGSRSSRQYQRTLEFRSGCSPAIAQRNADATASGGPGSLELVPPVASRESLGSSAGCDCMRSQTVVQRAPPIAAGAKPPRLLEKTLPQLFGANHDSGTVRQIYLSAG